MNWIVVREGPDPKIVTAILEILDKELPALTQVNQAIGQTDLQNLHRAPIPLHPATQRWMETNLEPAEGGGIASIGGAIIEVGYRTVRRPWSTCPGYRRSPVAG